MGSISPDLSGARVLVVEDEFYLAKDLALVLREQGAEVIGPAPTVQIAEQLIRHERPDCAILDMNLRGEHSVGFAARLTEQGIGYMILSGYDPDALPTSLRGAPYLEKPATASAVTRLVARLIGRDAI